MTIDITLLESLCSEWERTVTSIDGKKIGVRGYGVTKPGKEERLEGFGMWKPSKSKKERGDLVVIINVSFPVKLSNRQKGKIRDALETVFVPTSEL